MRRIRRFEAVRPALITTEGTENTEGCKRSLMVDETQVMVQSRSANPEHSIASLWSLCPLWW